MKNLFIHKIANTVTTLFSAAVTIGIYGYYFLGFCNERCSYEVMEGILDPLFFFFFGLTIISALFLLLPVNYFKTWSKFILPVATILIFIHAADVSVNTSGILNMSRAETVRFDMFLFGGASVAFILASIYRERTKNNVTKKGFNK